MTPAEMQEWRARLGITQARAAEMIGVSARAVKYWEAGQRSIPATVERLCAALEAGA